MPEVKKYPMTNQLQYIKKHIFMTVSLVNLNYSNLNLFKNLFSYGITNSPGPFKNL